MNCRKTDRLMAMVTSNMNRSLTSSDVLMCFSDHVLQLYTLTGCVKAATGNQNLWAMQAAHTCLTARTSMPSIFRPGV